jgi:hypothetical protein
MWTYGITQREEHPVNWNTNAHSGDHILKPEATIREAHHFPQLQYQTLDDDIGRNM